MVGNNRVRGVYEHKGWTGVEFESDFESKWGTIKRSEIFEGRSLPRSVAIRNARDCNYGFALVSTDNGPSVYRITASNAKSIDAILGYNKIKASKSKDDYRSNLDFRARQLVRAAKSRARKKFPAIDHDLAEDDIVARVSSGKCEVTGFPLDLETIGQAPFSPSLDQIDPGKGYTNKNVQVVCFIYNAMKRDFSADAIDRFIKHLKGNAENVV